MWILLSCSEYPRALVWDNTASKSIQHLALFYEYTLKNDQQKSIWHQKVFAEEGPYCENYYLLNSNLWTKIYHPFEIWNPGQ